LKCSLANGEFIVSSYENNRHGCARYLETVLEVDTRHITEVDIENDASRVAKSLWLVKASADGNNKLS